ncbi:MAG: hypothetical protein HUJ30_01360, partial [Gammaproteobacteria bacterium]|nr:hypothetical protein [Gammaproteobacteria bacterium]
MATLDTSKYTLIYTTAGYVLDRPSTEVVNSKIGTTISGHSFRLVAVPNDEVTVQVSQYLNNMERAYTEQDWRIETQFGNVIPLEAH